MNSVQCCQIEDAKSPDEGGRMPKMKKYVRKHSELRAASNS